MDNENSFPYLYTIKESNHDTNLYLLSLKKNKNNENRKKINENLVIRNPAPENKAKININSYEKFEFNNLRNKNNNPYNENDNKDSDNKVSENFNSKCPLNIKRQKLC